MVVDERGEPEAVPPGLRHVGDPDPGVCLRHPLAPDLQSCEAGHQHPDTEIVSLTSFLFLLISLSESELTNECNEAVSCKRVGEQNHEITFISPCNSEIRKNFLFPWKLLLIYLSICKKLSYVESFVKSK